MSTQHIERDAAISECGRYRWWLTRRWGDGPLCCWIMLNPSTADTEQDDPTIRRCMGFADRWGYGGIVVVNLFALRSTDPAELKRADDPVGQFNDESIEEHAKRSAFTVAAWGAHGSFRRRGRRVAKALWDIGEAPHCLGATKAGHPKHPLYLRADTEPMPLTTKGIPCTPTSASSL